MTKMYFYKTGSNSVSVKLDWKGGYKFRQGIGRGIRRNKGSDKTEFPLIVSYSVLDSFMNSNGISNNEVEVDSRSLEKFYGFYNDWDGKWTISATLSQDFVDRWWGYDCPTLYRMAPNKEGQKNWVGLKFSCFQNLLCEAGFYSDTIGDDITEEEVFKLTKGREHTSIHKEMKLMLKTRTVPKQEIEEMKRFVREYEDKVQTVIDMFAGEMISSVSKIEDGPPAGFLNIYTNDEEYNEKKSLLKQLDKTGHHASWMNVNLPRRAQSLHIQEEQFKIAKEKIEKALEISLYSQSVLD